VPAEGVRKVWTNELNGSELIRSTPCVSSRLDRRLDIGIFGETSVRHISMPAHPSGHVVPNSYAGYVGLFMSDKSDRKRIDGMEPELRFRLERHGACRRSI